MKEKNVYNEYNDETQIFYDELLKAIKNNNISDVKNYIDLGLNLNEPIMLTYSGGYTKLFPLQYALYFNNYEIIKMLVEAGANLGLNDSTFTWDPSFLSQIVYTNDGEFQAIADAILNVKSHPQEAYSAINMALKYQNFHVLQFLFDVGGKELIEVINQNENHVDFIQECISRGITLKFKNQNFILSTQFEGKFGFLIQKPTEDYKKLSATYFKDGKIYFKHNDNIVKNTLYSFSEASSEDETNIEKYVFVVDKKGILYLNEKIDSHIEFLYYKKGKLADVAKPTACGGHILIKDGKIVGIIDDSGHYKPNEDQLKLVSHHFYLQDVLAPGVKIDCFHPDIGIHTLTYEDIEKINPLEILGNYPELIY